MGKSTKFAIDYSYAKAFVMSSDRQQSDKFKNPRELGCNEGEARSDETLRKVARQKPEPEKPK
jgi:hypothetical protein